MSKKVHWSPSLQFLELDAISFNNDTEDMGINFIKRHAYIIWNMQYIYRYRIALPYYGDGVVRRAK